MKTEIALLSGPIRCDAETVDQAIADIWSGKRVVTLPNHERPLAGYNGGNQLAFALLWSDGLLDMSKKSRVFLAGMTEQAAFSFKQQKYLKDLARDHLGIEVDPPGDPEPSAYEMAKTAVDNIVPIHKPRRRVANRSA